MIQRLTLFVLLVWAFPGEAHQAVKGWHYDQACCNDRDCKQIHRTAVRATSEGYVWKGHLFPYNSTKLRHSGDEHFHGCQNPKSKIFYCLYIPVGGV